MRIPPKQTPSYRSTEVSFTLGKHDSSKTRVVPVFNHLLELDRTGVAWLDRLIRIGSRIDLTTVPVELGQVTNSLPSWGKGNEEPLPAPNELHEWLVGNITLEAVIENPVSEESQEKREALAAGDPEVLSEALYCLSRVPAGKVLRAKWYIFEGPSKPDAFIVTDNVILVIEGKRKDSLATRTKWMEYRPQLIRHMDGAMAIAGGRTVLSLLLVEGKSDDPMTVPVKWTRELEKHFQPDMLALSLPHRSDEERQLIVNGVLGIATWQRVCNEFSIRWPPAP